MGNNMQKMWWLCFSLAFSTTALSNEKNPVLTVLDMPSAFETTLQSNDLLSSRKAKSLADNEALDQAWAAVYPSVSVTGVYGRGEYSTAYTPTTDEQFQRFGVQIVQPLFSVRKFASIKRQSKFVDHSNLSYSLEEQKTLLDMTYAFLDLAKSQRLVVVSQNELEEHKVKFRGLQAMLKRGLATKMDVLEATAKQDDILASLVTARSQLLQNQKKLSRLIGGQSVGLVQIDENLWKRTAHLTELATWEALADKGSLDLKVAQSNVALAQMDASVGRAGYYPEVTLRAAIDNTDSYESTFRDNKKVQVEMVWPLYEGGITNSRVREAEQKTASNQYALDDARKMLHVQLNEVMTSLSSSVVNIEALERSLTSNKLYLESAEKGMSYGLRGVFDILDAKTRIFDTERKMVDQIYSNLQAQFELLYLTGILDPVHLRTFLSKDFTPALLTP